jgi:serine/threonine protein kinase
MSNPVSVQPAESRLPLAAGGLEAGVQIGDFRIERRLGAGGMGIVYQARQLSLDRPVALKVLGQALTQRADVSRFQREAQAAARLKHPAIAQVYFIGQDKHLCYLAMELIEGISLRQLLDRLGRASSAAATIDAVVKQELAEDANATPLRFDAPTEDAAAGTVDVAATASINPYLSPAACELRSSPAYVRRVAEVVRDGARALAHAHEQGVVHRDIKPDNLLLDRGGQVHIIDFGVARFFDDQAVTYTGQLVGTPLYMSPEQVTGRGGIDARTDIYSLGLVLYELLALRPPIEASNREHLLRTIVTKPLPPVSWRNSAVPPELERIVHQATQKDADERYAAAAKLADDLERYLGGKPVAAPAYHFRLDEREIIAARPSPVVLAAFAFFVVAAFLFVTGVSFAVLLGVMGIGSVDAGEMRLTAAIFGVGGTLLLAVGIPTGRGILRARGWAWWAGVLAAAMLVLLAVVGLVGLVQSAAWMLAMPDEVQRILNEAETGEQDGDGEYSPIYSALGFLVMLAVPLATGLALGSTAVWALLCRSTRDWFRFAAEIRREHKLLKERLAE